MGHSVKVPSMLNSSKLQCTKTYDIVIIRTLSSSFLTRFIPNDTLSYDILHLISYTLTTCASWTMSLYKITYTETAYFSQSKPRKHINM